MTSHLRRCAPIGLLALAVTTTIGCASTIEIMPSPTDHQDTATRSIAISERVPLLLEGFRVTQNGAPQHPSTGIERRILNQVQETRLFSTLVPLGGDTSSLGDKAITARVLFDETIDPHGGEAAWKGFVIGASMFLLSPVMELNYDYAAHASLELERWDGQVKRYEAHSIGTAHYNLFGASPVVIDELKGQVTEACLTELMEQLVRDTNFYMAGSTPLPESPLLAVTVKGRRAKPSPLGVTPIPISLPPAP
jgi:hypothetical protein